MAIKMSGVGPIQISLCARKLAEQLSFSQRRDVIWNFAGSEIVFVRSNSYLKYEHKTELCFLGSPRTCSEALPETYGLSGEFSIGLK